MQTVIIYDESGRIWNITYGEDSIPLGLKAISVNVPDGSQVGSIDLSEPDKPKVVYTYLPETDLERLQTSMSQVLAEMQRVSSAMEPVTAAVSFVAGSFTDAQALQVPSLYPEWSGDGIAYEAGERVRYEEVLYKVLQGHISQADWTPADAPSLFAKVLIEDPERIPEWEQPESTNGYQAGDRVTHGGRTWESLVDANVWEPGTAGTETVWKEVLEG